MSNPRLSEPVTELERRVARERVDIRFHIPPVHTGLWNEDDWVRWYRGGPNFNAIVAEEAAKAECASLPSPASARGAR